MSRIRWNDDLLWAGDRKDALTACEKWMRWRKKYLAPRSPNKKHIAREERDLNQQADDLRRSLDCLEFIADTVHEGNTFLLGHLATELRALVYFPDVEKGKRLNPTYNPLLLRLAQRGSLPLPLWAEITTKHRFLKKGMIQFVTSKAFMTPLITAPYLVDLQEWLLQPVVFVHDAQGQKVKYCNRDVILLTSVTMGSAHYDEHQPVPLTFMRDGNDPHKNTQLQHVLFWMSWPVIQLGDWVLERLARDGKIERRARISPRWNELQTRQTTPTVPAPSQQK